MKDLIFEMHKGLTGHSEEFQKAAICGLISGLGAQMALAKEESANYDGSLVRILKVNSRNSVARALSDVGGEWEKILSPDLFLGWGISKTVQSEIYFSYMSEGALYVSKAINELEKEVGLSVKITLFIVEQRVQSLIRDLLVLL